MSDGPDKVAKVPLRGASVAQLAQRSGLLRSQARLAAVQALYQMDIAATDLNKLIEEFTVVRFGADAEDETVAFADQSLFQSIVRGVVAHQAEIDPALDSQLAAGWRLNRIDATVRAVLRSGMFEILYRKDVPPRVIISEYVDIAKAFFEGDEPKVVNAVLDKLAKKHRGAELGSKS
jgi:transcription antitermination protein NusB